jgi:putative membrane protein
VSTDFPELIDGEVPRGITDGASPAGGQDGVMHTIGRIAVTALAVAVAAWLIPGITVTGSSQANIALTVILVAVIIGVVNAVVKPLVSAITGCLILVTLGLFLVVINAWMLMLSSWISGLVGLGFHVDGFWPAVLGGIVISIVSALLSGFFKGAQDRRS